MTTSIRMNGSKNKADTRSIHLLVRLFSVPKSSHAISPFIFIRLGQLLHPSCGFRTHLYSLQSGNCIALANVLQKASLQTPSPFGKTGSSRGNVPYLDIICTTLRLCNIVGEGGKHLYHPLLIQSSQRGFPQSNMSIRGREHEHTIWRPAKALSINQSINLQVHSCSPGY